MTESKNTDNNNTVPTQQPSSKQQPAGFAPHVSRPLIIPEGELTKPHRFWDNQPVPKVQAEITSKCGALDDREDVGLVKKDALTLPEGFEWCVLDVMDEKDIEEIYTLLDNNYVEDDDACFRFQYSIDCLRWALTPPDYEKDWHIGVRTTNSNTLVAFISGIPARINVYNDIRNMAEVNFLCVHKRLRSRRLAPVLIREVTRRVNLKNIWQAVYTAGVFLPRPVSDCRYYHRSLNIKKLVEVGFSHLPLRQTIQMAQRLISLPDHFTLSNIYPMEEKYIDQVSKLLNDDFKKRNVQLHPIFNSHEVKHWLLPKKGVINSYVRLAQPKKDAPDSQGDSQDDSQDDIVTDFFSYYELPSNVIRHNQVHNVVKAAYNYYTAATSVELKDILLQALIAARDQSFDVFNALDLGHNHQTFQDLKFGVGDGSLKYYLYNWECPPMNPENIGLILM